MIDKSIIFLDKSRSDFIISCNRFFFCQTLLCVIYCVYKGRYLPPDRKAGNNRAFPILQFLGMLVAHIVIFITEFFFISSWILRFNNIIHHIFSLLLFVQTIIEADIICVVYCIPYLFHTFYWSNLFGFSNTELIIYNFFLMACSYFGGIVSCLKHISYKIPIFGNLLIQINILYFIYGGDINLNTVNHERLLRSIILSTLFTMPFNIFVLLKSRRKTKSSSFVIV